MYDVAEELKIEKRRATCIIETCYASIVRLQKEKADDQIKKVITEMMTMCLSANESFLAGFLLGRIIQIDETAREGIEPFIEEHVAELEKASEKVREHPEFS